MTPITTNPRIFRQGSERRRPIQFAPPPALPAIECGEGPSRRADAVERLKWSLACAYGRLEEAAADSRRLVATFSSEDDFTRERTALHLSNRLEGLLHQVQEAAVEISDLREAAARLHDPEGSAF